MCWCQIFAFLPIPRRCFFFRAAPPAVDQCLYWSQDWYFYYYFWRLLLYADIVEQMILCSLKCLLVGCLDYSLCHFWSLPFPH